MYIDGNWATAEGVFEVTNPANGDVIGSVPDGSRADAARAIDAAAKAVPYAAGLGIVAADGAPLITLRGLRVQAAGQAARPAERGMRLTAVDDLPEPVAAQQPPGAAAPNASSS